MRMTLLVAALLLTTTALVAVAPTAQALKCDVSGPEWGCTHNGAVIFELEPGCIAVLEPCG